jgi:hypothetical protein
MAIGRIFLLGLLTALVAVGLSGCLLTEGSSYNPEFAGSMKASNGLFPPPKPLGEMPGSRVREGD